MRLVLLPDLLLRSCLEQPGWWRSPPLSLWPVVLELVPSAEARTNPERAASAASGACQSGTGLPCPGSLLSRWLWHPSD